VRALIDAASDEQWAAVTATFADWDTNVTFMCEQAADALTEGVEHMTDSLAGLDAEGKGNGAESTALRFFVAIGRLLLHGAGTGSAGARAGSAPAATPSSIAGSVQRQEALAVEQDGSPDCPTPPLAVLASPADPPAVQLLLQPACERGGDALTPHEQVGAAARAAGRAANSSIFAATTAPRFAEMASPELEACMAGYGMAAGSREYMLAELAGMWSYLHAGGSPVTPGLPLSISSGGASSARRVAAAATSLSQRSDGSGAFPAVRAGAGNSAVAGSTAAAAASSAAARDEGTQEVDGDGGGGDDTDVLTVRQQIVLLFRSKPALHEAALLLDDINFSTVLQECRAASINVSAARLRQVLQELGIRTVQPWRPAAGSQAGASSAGAAGGAGSRRGR
jgi:hypothetical protein